MNSILSAWRAFWRPALCVLFLTGLAHAGQYEPREVATNYRQFVALFDEYRTTMAHNKKGSEEVLNGNWAVLGVLLECKDEKFAAWVVKQKGVSGYLKEYVLPILEATRRKHGISFPKTEALIRKGW